MSYWPNCLDEPAAVALLHWLNSDTDIPFALSEAAWPNLEIHSLLPLHIIKVCAVAIHRDEIEWTKEQASHSDECRTPGFEFSGYVVSTSPYSPLLVGTEV